MEGGWPKDVDSTDIESKKRYIKKADKEEKYIRAMKSLSEPLEHYIKQNVAIDMYGQYFTNSSYSDLNSNDNPSAKTVSVFRDPVTSHKRTAVDMSWQPPDGKKLAVAYGILQFQKMPVNMPMDSYIWDVSNPNVPESKITPMSPICCLDFNPKDANTIISGCYNGVVTLFDLRKGSSPVLYSQLKFSHKDPVYDVRWLQSKNATSFLSCSTDGQVIIWDTRYLAEPPKECYNLQLSPEKAEGSAYLGLLGGESIDYDPMYSATKFMIGSEQGVIVSCTRRKNKPIQLDKAYFGHHGPIYALQRNPFNPKYFLSIGDWTAKIWNEDMSNPIITTAYDTTYLTDGCWSNSRPGVFFTTKMDGSLDIWDILYRQNKPVLSVSVSDAELQSISCKDGKYIVVGATDGTASLIELSESLSGFSGDEKLPATEERNNLTNVFDRETRREKLLVENKRMAAQIKKKDTAKNQEQIMKADDPELQEVLDYFQEQTK